MHFYEQQDIKQERHLEQNVFQVLGLLTSKHALKKTKQTLTALILIPIQSF